MADQPMKSTSLNQFLKAFQEWRNIQMIINSAPEGSEVFEEALEREVFLVDYIDSNRAVTGLERDVKWIVLATNGLIDCDKKQLDRLMEQFTILFGPGNSLSKHSAVDQLVVQGKGGGKEEISYRILAKLL